jgi:hypothetical protein
MAAGNPKLARPEYESAREIARQFGARVLLCEATRGLAEAELALGDPRRARDDARTAFEIAERMGAAPLVGAALRVVAAAVGQGAPGEADLAARRCSTAPSRCCRTRAPSSSSPARWPPTRVRGPRGPPEHGPRAAPPGQATSSRPRARGGTRPRAEHSAAELALH